MRAVLGGAVRLPPDLTRIVLIHGDLQAEHILIGPDGSAAGVIDWGDTALSDSDGDFAGFYTWLGPTFARRCLAAYPLPAADGFWDRVAFRGQG